ncbi:hypothetical protein HDG34_002505 [Paraburkholderia sp. HC6.4b]|uniref:hypothetical protein n=1 Tax=unclassified Paraburkholderia TaxID=2615204 RepID=UPI0016191F2B|nr:MULTISPECIES: hypothetical protein [unclassified Paraburkholderia]MBB5408568.1 hypothetical protein [Paraburkholderia sp. HC6.4b]MBB5450400.1 hypothetical protein [Paraburkholderia sp. Kb1A]
MLELTHHPMKIAHLNLRSEMHGDDEVSCVDIRLSFDVPNGALDALAAGLRATLYEVSDDPDMLDPDADHLTHVRYPQLGILRWAGEHSGVGMRLHSGNGRGKGDLVFPDAVFGKLTVRPLEGGTCTCIARAQVQPSTDEAAKLFGLLKHEVPVSLDMTNAADTDSDEE